MKIRDLDRSMLNTEGKEFEDKATFRKILITACLATDPEDKTNADTKYKVGMLAFKLQKAQKSVEVTAEEVTMLKERIGKYFGPLVVVRVYDLLEQKKPAEEQVNEFVDQEEDTPLKKVK